ncbi:MAG: hypothetical protein K0Q74_1121 [Gammaproteobacteria bacterium]|jgi:hypothetical protein|nr:hypothetical protein [Gammaproteobacteria bacterium]
MQWTKTTEIAQRQTEQRMTASDLCLLAQKELRSIGSSLETAYDVLKKSASTAIPGVSNVPVAQKLETTEKNLSSINECLDTLQAISTAYLKRDSHSSSSEQRPNADSSAQSVDSTARAFSM